ncbi:MAG: orotidine 5'-phosphate decarboxylase / HUMPS family protein [bacterium]|nr:orotidine 5'-phosphate decarboxylase / HUMPS family protein [bacterium]
MQRVVPAILTQDPKELKEKLELFQGHTKWMHIDIMDGTLVPGRTMNLFELGEASKFFNLEIHLMVEDPFKYFEDCAGLGAKRVIFHQEAIRAKEPMLSALDSHEFQKGIALNKVTSPELISSYGKKISSILLMGIEPGAQGRPFDSVVLARVKKMKEMYPSVLCGVDGGIGKDNIQSVFGIGADYAVVGSEIMQAEDPIAAFKKFEEMVDLQK